METFSTAQEAGWLAWEGPVAFHTQLMGVTMTHMQRPNNWLDAEMSVTNCWLLARNISLGEKQLYTIRTDSSGSERVASAAKMAEPLCQRDACFLLLRHESKFVLPARSIYIHKSILQH